MEIDSEMVQEFKKKIQASGKSYLLDNEDESTDEYAHFYFIGQFNGRETVYDAVIYTLRLQYESELFEIAEHRAAVFFPEYKKITYDEDENGNLEVLDPLEEEIGLFMAEVIVELEEEEAVKVKEHVDIDSNADFRVGLDIGLHVGEISEAVLEKFIKDYNDDSLKLDDTHYTFQTLDDSN